MTGTPEQLKVVITGHVDHGKSTFVGRLMHDTGSLSEGRLEQLEQAAQRRGVPFEWSNVIDALQAERDQNVTIDTAQAWFRTAQRQYVLIDAPGHREFIKNMVTGAAAADAALLVIDAAEGVQEQSRRHGFLLGVLGIEQVAVLVNKMDAVGYDVERFHAVTAEYRRFMETIGITPTAVVPMSARDGVNLASRGSEMPWWTGPTVVEVLDGFTAAPSLSDRPLRFAVQDIYRFDQRRLLAGRIESGTLRAGQRLLFCPSGKTSAVRTIERWNAPQTDQAEAGESIAITLTEQIYIEPGAIASAETTPPYQLPRFRARLFWLGREPLRADRPYRLKLATQDVPCEVESVERVTDASTLHSLEYTERNGVGRYEVADLWLRSRRPIAFDAYREISTTGRFVLVDGYEVAGGGIILPADYPRRTSDAMHRGANLYWNEGKVSAVQRAARNGHAGLVVWFTGLSGSGKSTIAMELERELFNQGRQAYVLDGDNIRHGLCADLGFSETDRAENIRRVGEVSKLMADAGLLAITAFISPYRRDRDIVRQTLPQGRFIEVYVNAPLEVCEQRDPKGLYVKARSGEIADFTGVSAPYEAPLAPDVELRTDRLTVQESVAAVLDYLMGVLRSTAWTSPDR